ncbi:Hsp20/alpha crystallin family protein [Patescibacteria group bacterium]|nr:Hsp20/alpha crystallin family protein [Patescibacteria group bacterium]
MPIVKYNPVRELQTIQRDLERLWDFDWDVAPSFETMPFDIYEDDGNLIAETSLPKFKKEEISVTLDSGLLEVKAVHDENVETKDRRYYLHESSNSYLRRVSIPENVKLDKAEAEFKDGILKITMPIGSKSNAKLLPVK